MDLVLAFFAGDGDKQVRSITCLLDMEPSRCLLLGGSFFWSIHGPMHLLNLADAVELVAVKEAGHYPIGCGLTSKPITSHDQSGGCKDKQARRPRC